MSILAQPRDLAELTEIDPQVPPGVEDRFSGYGVMGLPLASGHVLALRRFPASSLGYGYSSVWHRDPAGRWTFWSDVAPEASCGRFFGAAIDEAAVAPIRVHWPAPCELAVSVSDGLLEWEMTLRVTPVTVAMNAVGALLTDAMWRRPAVLRAMSRVAGRLLDAGRVTLVGRSPNGQAFVANPLRVWRVATATARLDGRDLGAPGPLPEQAFLGDFAIPQRGVFVIGRSLFERFDPRRHSSAVVRTASPARNDRAGD